jgi:hypothetical protein
MLFNRKFASVLVAGLGLTVGAVAHAEIETGLVKVTAFATGSYLVEAGAVRMASPDPLKSGALCGNGGDMALQLAGEGGQAIYAAVLAASINGKSATVNFSDDGNGNCEVVAVSL